ncbi:MAG: glutamine-hydrolyzing GMP synthase, partial [Acidimicrobiales bacterium]
MTDLAVDTILVVDFGAQYAQLIARRVREAHVYSEIVPHTITAAEIAARQPAGVIFSGGPASVHVEDAPRVDLDIYDSGVPILGICYGAQLLALDLGGEVSRTDRGEYGRTELELVAGSASSVLFGAAQPVQQPVWMSHFDTITAAPTGALVTASTADTPAAGFEDVARGLYGVQFHPEVVHTPHGQALLEQFLYEACGCKPTWTMSSVIETSIDAIRAQVGDRRAICGLSGGVDSAVAAARVHRAIGSQLTCVFVDTGLMRQGEGDQVVETFRRHQGIELIHVRAGDRFFEKLEG